jgi:hypothetical protein
LKFLTVEKFLAQMMLIFGTIKGKFFFSLARVARVVMARATELAQYLYQGHNICRRKSFVK